MSVVRPSSLALLGDQREVVVRPGSLWLSTPHRHPAHIGDVLVLASISGLSSRHGSRWLISSIQSRFSRRSSAGHVHHGSGAVFGLKAPAIAWWAHDHHVGLLLGTSGAIDATTISQAHQGSHPGQVAGNLGSNLRVRPFPHGLGVAAPVVAVFGHLTVFNLLLKRLHQSAGDLSVESEQAFAQHHRVCGQFAPLFLCNLHVLEGCLTRNARDFRDLAITQPLGSQCPGFTPSVYAVDLGSVLIALTTLPSSFSQGIVNITDSILASSISSDAAKCQTAGVTDAESQKPGGAGVSSIAPICCHHLSPTPVTPKAVLLQCFSLFCHHCHQFLREAQRENFRAKPLHQQVRGGISPNFFCSERVHKSGDKGDNLTTPIALQSFSLSPRR